MNRLVKITIHREGKNIIFFTGLFFILVNTSVFLLARYSDWRWILLIATVFTFGWVCLFFRHPERNVEPSEELIYAPADGTVVSIEKTMVEEYFGMEMIQISIFMSAFNIHVNRYPIGGIVKYTHYFPGRHLVAFHPKSSDKNENTSTVIMHPSGKEIMVRQIAGAVARRIVSYARNNQHVVQGNELGFIKFGSRVDLFLPPDCLVDVLLKQKVYGNKTVIARFS
jgi:phosphatidylserine decarboxylase